MPSFNDKKSRPLALLCAAVALAAAAGTRAADFAVLDLHLAQGKNFKRLTLGAETDPAWSRGLSWGRVDLLAEFGLSYWRADQPGANDRLWQLNAIPIVRWWPTERFYLEGGVGLTVFDRTRFIDKELSTAFQFGDHLGLGWQLTPSIRIGARVSHFSNAAIKRPNPGLDATQLTLAYRF